MIEGQEVWFVSMYDAIAIRCKIVEIDDQWRKRHPSGILFYWIDEPVGHGLDEEELFLTREDAEEFLETLDDYKGTLANYRRRMVKFIVSTHKHPADKVEEAEKELLNSYPEKEHGKDWF